MKYIIIILLFFSCKVSDKTYKKVATDTKVTSEKKAIIAPWVSVYFPISNKVIAGQTMVTVDTVFRAYSYYDTVFNMLVHRDTVTLTKTIHRTDTTYQEDYAKLLISRRQVAELEGEIVAAKLNQRNAEIRAEKVAGRERNMWLWIIGLAIALAVSIYLHIKKIF
jgi:hypothetical protein